MRYELQAGVVLDADKVRIIHDETTGGRRASANPAQQALDLNPTPRKPWEGVHPKLTAPFNLRLNATLHAKLKYLATIVPNVSMNTIAIKAIETEVARLLAQYDKP